eukprot:gnl/TRDRNA2_/TRDRNA2_170390_c2_seq1.p1 gnl/TRDRNA2_/TRDRNA2_170390_c2~~gnl/TRDRNA2_/TRDRNA2_170390_c2_seq1.p1  ORF type:complete len:314 (-),score=44.73 gnl/TRDRNA2_/TRDRNA2_170390_c2_seq1:32-880(-)
MAAVVDSSMEARKGTLHEIAYEHQQECEKAKKRLKRICAGMDEDASGDLTLEEMMHGATNITEFRDSLNVLDISADDIPLVFGMLDTDKSGSVGYEEFVDELYELVGKDTRSMLVFIKAYISDVRHHLASKLDSEVIQICQDVKQILSDEQTYHGSNVCASADLHPESTGKRLERAFSLTADSLASHIERLHNEMSTKLDEAKAILNELRNDNIAYNVRTDLTPAGGTLATTACCSPTSLDAMQRKRAAPAYQSVNPQSTLSSNKVKMISCEERVDLQLWAL